VKFAHAGIVADLPKLLPLLLLLGAPEARQAARANPHGGAQGCAPFSEQQDAASENSRDGCEPRAQSAWGAPPGCAFFWLLFFAQAKKSDSRGSAKRLSNN
jgi:hypothetical protein